MLEQRERQLSGGARSAAKDMRQARSREQEFLDIAGVMLMALDRDGRVTLMNKKGYAVLGYEEGELVGAHWITVCLPARVRDEMELAWQKAMSGEHERVEYYESPVLTKQGEERLVAWHHAFMKDDAGTVTGILTSGEDITEREEAQDALRESEARCRSLFENSLEAILLTSPDGTIWAANPEACHLFGWKGEDLVRIGRRGIVDVTDPRLGFALRESERAGKARAEATFIRKDGTRFEGAVSSANFNDRNGDPRTSMIIRDITGPERAMERLREYEKVVEGSQDLICVMDHGYRYLLVNDTFAKYRGMSKEHIIGRTCAELVGTDIFEQRIRKNLDRSLEGEPLQYEMKFIYPELGERDIIVSYFPIEGTGGVREVVTIIRDITERIKSREAHQESEEKFGLLFEKSVDPVLLMDGNTYIDCNEAALRLMGCSAKDQIVGLSPLDISPQYQPDGRLSSEKMKELRDAALPEGVKRFEWMWRTFSGEEFWVDVSQTVIPVKGKPIMYTAWRDIRERKRAEEALRESEDRLRALAACLQAVREKERARVAREIHDELGQALACMKIDLWEIKQDSSSDRVDKDAVLLKIEGLLRFIDATVDTVRRIASDLRPAILDDLGLVPAIEWQLSDFQRRTGMICEFRKPRSLVIDKDCSGVLFRVFQESLTNIVRHSEAKKVEITLRKTKAELVLAIRDNGKGIPESEVSNRASLGILGMRERVLPFDGHIQISGKPGKGTRVTVRIPLPGRRTNESQRGHRGSL